VTPSTTTTVAPTGTTVATTYTAPIHWSTNRCACERFYHPA
jgi:hypothetical protein